MEFATYICVGSQMGHHHLELSHGNLLKQAIDFKQLLYILIK